MRRDNALCLSSSPLVPVPLVLARPRPRLSLSWCRRSILTGDEDKHKALSLQNTVCLIGVLVFSVLSSLVHTVIMHTFFERPKCQGSTRWTRHNEFTP